MTGLAKLQNTMGSTGRSSGRGRVRLTERHPDIRIALRLALHEAVARLGTEQDLLVLIVQNKLALISFDREHGVTIAALVADDRDQQRLTGPPGQHEHAPFEQYVI